MGAIVSEVSKVRVIRTLELIPKRRKRFMRLAEALRAQKKVSAIYAV
jgi:hypothetical protein